MRKLNPAAWAAIHDDPVAKLKAQAAEAHSKSPYVTRMKEQAGEVRALGQKHREEGLELERKHRVARNRENEVDRPKDPRTEEKREKEHKELLAKHDREHSALRQRHERELSNLKG